MPWDLDDLEEDEQFAVVAPEETARLEELLQVASSPPHCLDVPGLDFWDEAPVLPTPIVFLDVDGVLHSVNAAQESFFSPPQMEQIRRVVEETQARLVLSSTWRFTTSSANKVIAALASKGLKRPIGATPDVTIALGGRAAEIRSWLDSHVDLVDRWVAIDDIPLSPYLPADNTVTTDSYIGLTHELADEAIHKLAKR